MQELRIDSEELNDFSDSGLKQKGQTLSDAMKKREEEIIFGALNESVWNRTKTASILGINRKTLFKKIKHYQLTSPSKIGAFGPTYGVDDPNDISSSLQ